MVVELERRRPVGRVEETIVVRDIYFETRVEPLLEHSIERAKESIEASTVGRASVVDERQS